ncbi:NF-X1-type zinc finger protein NFXL2 [Tanacetum coccineum]
MKSTVHHRQPPPQPPSDSDSSDSDTTTSTKKPDQHTDFSNTIFQAYTHLSNHDSPDLTKIQSFLTSSRAGALSCLICLERIRPIDPTWQCSTRCHDASFHLICLAVHGLDNRGDVFRSASRDPTCGGADDSIATWNCPKCRIEFPKNVVPKKYLCFCGKVEDPVHDPWVLPHSCGEKDVSMWGNRDFIVGENLDVPCGTEKEQKPPKCSKRCQYTSTSYADYKCHYEAADLMNTAYLLSDIIKCHYGACPQCVWLSVKKKKKQHHHQSESTPGSACPPCPELVWRPCVGEHIGADRMTVCSNKAKFSCDNYCGNLLPCGNHFCTKTCHALKISGSGEQCEKCSLPCQREREPLCQHPCPLKCHPEECPPCKVLIKRACHCGAMVHVFECLYYNTLSEKEQIAVRSCKASQLHKSYVWKYVMLVNAYLRKMLSKRKNYGDSADDIAVCDHCGEFDYNGIFRVQGSHVAQRLDEPSGNTKTEKEIFKNLSLEF